MNLLILYWGLYHTAELIDFKIMGRLVCKIKGKHDFKLSDCIEFNHRVISDDCRFCDESVLLEIMQKGDNGWYRIPNITENDHERLHYEEVKFD